MSNNIHTNAGKSEGAGEAHAVPKVLAIILTMFVVYGALSHRLNTFQQLGSFLLITHIYIFTKFKLVDMEIWKFKYRGWMLQGIDLLLIVATLVSFGYLVLNSTSIMQQAGSGSEFEILLGFIAAIVVLEATRRTVNTFLAFFVATFVVYFYAGPIIPGQLSHPAFSSEQLMVQTYLSSRGLLAFPTDVMYKYVYLFVLFGAFLEFSGGGKFFLEFSKSLMGSRTGGPAKISVVGSGFMGMLSGSTVANTLTTGAFTIPTMKEHGYKPDFAAGVESAASTGGQLTPPVMGAAIFIMIELTGVDYLTIIKRAAFPAFIYFFTIYMVVHFHSKRSGMAGMPRSALPDIRSSILQSYYFIPVVILLALLYVGYSVQRSLLYSLVGLLLVTSLTKDRLFDPRRKGDSLLSNPFIKSIEKTTERAAPIIAAAAAIGIVLGIVTLTGTPLKISSLMITIAAGSVLLALMMSALLCIIFGMGTDTVTVYILLAVLVAPALTQLGLETIGVHLFILYFGMMAMVTPPVCLAAYAASTIAESDPMDSGFWAMKLSLAAFILPFAFVYGNELLLIGPTGNIVLAVATAVAGSIILAIGVAGYFKNTLSIVSRVGLVIASVLLIHVATLTDVAGLILAVVALAISKLQKTDIESPQGS